MPERLTITGSVVLAAVEVVDAPAFRLLPVNIDELLSVSSLTHSSALANLTARHIETLENPSCPVCVVLRSGQLIPSRVALLSVLFAVDAQQSALQAVVVRARPLLLEFEVDSELGQFSIFQQIGLVDYHHLREQL